MESESSSGVAGQSTVAVVPKVMADTPGEEAVAAVVKFRNVNTQHGDYRSVDEANIVVLRLCHSPEPKPVLVDGQEQPAVWIEEFVPPENEVRATGHSSAHVLCFFFSYKT